MLAVMIGIAIGIGLPIQTSINSRLRQSVGSPFLASLISFAIGTVFLGLITLSVDHSIWFSNELFVSQPWWLWLGGLFGVVYLTGNILLFPKLGSVQTVIMPVCGQILMGLLIDNFGWFYSGVTPLTSVRLLGAACVLLGVVITVAVSQWLTTRHQPRTNQVGGGLWFWRLLGVGAGMLSATQTAVNGHLGQVLNSGLKAALISFLFGTIALVLINLVLRPTLTLSRPTKQANPWWMWIGGMIGSLYVLGNVYLVPMVGTGLAVVIVLVGLITGSLLIDQFGWLGAKRQSITVMQVLGLVVMIGGVALIRLF
ncbi:hypothetical protein C5Z25_11530 [Lactobacillus sp. CBA3605]|uniref:DMT family transporter n=1 Tax=Lactobacillus sp. CBA3605 TaxID=2099788 RepID=UPI000CFB31A9|nr:DMT family transporter [Lactobacillus sp. CBA3605]AVK62348.1 hypothetical protein C5Z25_11530 [Lactobacillus sp. CBA3605]